VLCAWYFSLRFCQAADLQAIDIISQSIKGQLDEYNNDYLLIVRIYLSNCIFGSVVGEGT
jgi:hypothetical protein